MLSSVPTALERSMFSTIAYHAYFGYPLTLHEIWKWVMADEPVTFADVRRALVKSEWLRDRIVQVGPYYGIGDVSSQVQNRARRYADAMRKYRKAHWFARIFQWLPGVESVAICNSLAFHFTTSSSDIDLFIVTSSRNTWTARLLTTLPAMLFRQRPGECALDPLCLSFFVSVDALDLSNLKLDADDPYFSFWFATLSPMIVRDDVLANVWGANNWLRQRLPNAEPVRRASAFRVRPRNRAWRLLWLEPRAERMQRERFPAHIRDLMNVDTRVVVTNSVLKFHDHDRREEIRAALRAKLNV